jgi:regulator of protease activity HflC (stomatin/prohibitin superfamily)
MFGFKIVSQYAQGLVFRWGKLQTDARKPGLIWVNPVSDRVRKVNMQIMVAAVPGQQAITPDNVSVQVGAVVYYRSSTRPRRS